jgi:glutamate N-acetyltransferase/amino-acid N-acetyltransferase
MARATARTVGVPQSRIAVASTGVIGVPLPIDQVETGISRAAAQLSATGFEDFAAAILTTDRGPKVARRQLKLGGTRVNLIGCTKGAGMIAPDMATTLTFVVTDAAFSPTELRAALGYGCAESFNAITVDGDTSTNDMILLLANGAARPRPVGGRGREQFNAALRGLLAELARSLIREGEGVHHVVTVRVQGARSPASARAVARTIANSPLVKTAIAGQDPNWGRVLAAAGRAGVPIAPARLDLWFGGVAVAVGGRGIMSAGVERRARAVMARPEYELRLSLGAGKAEASYLACDLSHEYVSINADYRS